LATASSSEEIIERVSSICNKSPSEVRAAVEGVGMSIRIRILELLLEHGALRFNSLHRELGVFKGTLKWHLEKLERAGIIASFKFRNSRYIYIRGLEFRLIKKLVKDYRRRRRRSRSSDLVNLLRDMCFSDDVEDLARRYGVEVSAVESLQRIVVSAFGNARGDDCFVLLQLMAIFTSS